MANKTLNVFLRNILRYMCVRTDCPGSARLTESNNESMASTICLAAARLLARSTCLDAVWRFIGGESIGQSVAVDQDCLKNRILGSSVG